MRSGLKLETPYITAGGGHIAAVRAFQAVVKKSCPDWEINDYDLQDVLREIDTVRRFTPYETTDIYNLALENGWTYAGGFLLTGAQFAARLKQNAIVKILHERWLSSDADALVSFIPNFNRPMFGAWRTAHPDRPYITVMTDMVDLPGRFFQFWQERQPQYIIAGNPRAVWQAKQAGYTDDQIRQTSGMILHPSHYDLPAIDRRAGRMALGLDPDMTTLIIMFGGNGSMVSLDITKRLREAKLPVQCIVMCGHNHELYTALQSFNRPGYPAIYPQKFTKNVASIMALADIFAGKPGPASISEALLHGLVPIVENGLRTMPQEKFNAAWLQDMKYGISIPSFSHIPRVIQSLLDNNRALLRQMSGNVASYTNRAVFELPAIINDIIEHHQPGLHQVPTRRTYHWFSAPFPHQSKGRAANH